MNRKKLTPRRIDRFLEVLSETCNVSKAAQEIGVHRDTLYTRRDNDLEFLARWNQAVERGAAALEDEAARRAREGVEEPVWHNGKQVGTVRRYSDTLLMFLLNGAKPEKYRRNVSAEITGKNGAPLVPPTLGLKISFPDGGPGE